MSLSRKQVLALLLLVTLLALYFFIKIVFIKIGT